MSTRMLRKTTSQSTGTQGGLWDSRWDFICAAVGQSAVLARRGGLKEARRVARGGMKDPQSRIE